MDNDNFFKTAFPFVYKDHQGDTIVRSGLSKREFIATQILAGMSNKATTGAGLHTIGLIRLAVIMADQLLMELENEPT